MKYFSLHFYRFINIVINSFDFIHNSLCFWSMLEKRYINF